MLFILCLAVILGTIPGAIAQSRGHSFVAWWLFGSVLFIVALPMSFMLQPPRPQRMDMNPNAARRWQKVVNSEDDVEKWAKEQNNDSPEV